MDPESVVLEEGEILEESETLEDDTAQVCPICFLPLCSGDLTLECKHTFHSECIVRWFRSKNDTCPLCRAEPEVTLKLPDVFHRAKVLIDRQKNGDLNDEYIAMQIQQLQECDHRLRELQDEKNSVKNIWWRLSGLENKNYSESTKSSARNSNKNQSRYLKH